MTKLLLETTNYMQAKLFSQKRKGSKLIYENTLWKVINESEAVDKELANSNERIQKAKEIHALRATWLRHIEKELDHVGKITGEVEHNNDNHFSKKFPEHDVDEFHAHMAKKGYKLKERNEERSQYHKEDDLANYNLHHGHQPGQKDHVIELTINPKQQVQEALDSKETEAPKTIPSLSITEARRGRPSLKPSEDEQPDSDQHIIHQLRKILDNHKGGEVAFLKGKEIVHPGHAHGVLLRHAMLAKAADKEAFQNRIAKSYDELKSALKEAVNYEIEINEMAYGKPGRRTNAQKAADEAEEKSKAEKAAKENAARAAKVAEQRKLGLEHAKKHVANFDKEFAAHLKNEGFSKIHEGKKRTIWAKMDPKSERHHSISIENPHDEYNKHLEHEREINMGSHGKNSTSFSSHRYKPEMWDEKNQNDEHEAKKRKHVMEQATSELLKDDPWDR